jgi:hypothetical protein
VEAVTWLTEAVEWPVGRDQPVEGIVGVDPGEGLIGGEGGNGGDAALGVAGIGEVEQGRGALRDLHAPEPAAGPVRLDAGGGVVVVGGGDAVCVGDEAHLAAGVVLGVGDEEAGGLMVDHLLDVDRGVVDGAGHVAVGKGPRLLEAVGAVGVEEVVAAWLTASSQPLLAWTRRAARACLFKCCHVDKIGRGGPFAHAAINLA